VAAQEQRAVVTQVQQEPAELCQLHWPRIYTWAVTKVRVCVYVSCLTVVSCSGVAS
jgi:hypothetical protein